MKTLLIALTLSLGIAFTANAQVNKRDRTNKSQQTQVQSRDQQRSTDQQRQQQPNVDQQVKSQTDMMQRDLDLQPDQVQQITAENRNLYNNMNNMGNRNLSEQDYNKQRKEAMDQHDKRMKDILNDDQYKKYSNTKTNYYKDIHNSRSSHEYNSPQGSRR